MTEKNDEEQKSDWFVYIDTNDRHCVPFGSYFEGLTEVEAIKKANELAYSAIGDEPDYALFNLWMSYEDCPEDVEDGFAEGYYDMVCRLFRVGGSTNIPILPLLKRSAQEMEDWRKAEEERQRQREIEQLKRLQDKYPEVSNS